MRSRILLWMVVVTAVGVGVFAVPLAFTLSDLHREEKVVRLERSASEASSEIPADFPATELWQFRIGTVAIQATLWSVLAFGFGLAAQRVMTRDASSTVRNSVGSPATS